MPSDTCFVYGKSTANQRIEAWWSILRRQASDWWINFCKKKLRDDGLIRDHDALSMACLRFCFMGVLQRELNQVAILWNQHTIQIKKNNPGPRGRTSCSLSHSYMTPSTLRYHVTTTVWMIAGICTHQKASTAGFLESSRN